MLLVVVRAPASGPPAAADPERSARAAKVAGLSAADVRHRLQGTLPRVLLNDADGDRLAAIGERLEELGFATVVCDPRLAPTDADRVIGARRFVSSPTPASRWTPAGGEHECPFAAVEAIQRGTRVTTQTTKEKTVEHKFDVGRAVLSSGLILTRKEVKETVRKTETTEPFALVQRNDGEPDIIALRTAHRLPRAGRRHAAVEPRQPGGGRAQAARRRAGGGLRRSGGASRLHDARCRRPRSIRSIWRCTW